MAMLSNPEPSPSAAEFRHTQRENAGNIIELKNPTARMLHMATWPLVSMEIVTRLAVPIAQTPSRCPVRIFCNSAEPMNRPPSRPPVEGDVSGGVLRRQAGDVGLAEVVHQKAADRDFRPHVGEDSDGAQHEIGMLPNRVADFFPRRCSADPIFGSFETPITMARSTRATPMMMYGTLTEAAS